MMLSAFGIGMAWATAIIPFYDCHISNIVEIYNNEDHKKYIIQFSYIYSFQ